MNEKIIVIKHVENEGPGLIESLIRRKGWQMETIMPAQGDGLPENLAGIAAVIMLGGPMSVNDTDECPFLQDELTFIEKVLEEEMPFLGICLGSQMLAKACNAKVFKAPQKEIGWCRIDLTEEGQKDILFRDIAKNIMVFQWHEDTFNIPENGRHLAKSDVCGNQAFKIGRNAYGIQFHIETTEDMVKSWMTGLEEDIDAEKIINDTAMIMDLFQLQYEQIMMNFARLIESYVRYKKIVRQYIESGHALMKNRQVMWWETEGMHLGSIMNKHVNETQNL